MKSIIYLPYPFKLVGNQGAPARYRLEYDHHTHNIRVFKGENTKMELSKVLNSEEYDGSWDLILAAVRHL